MSLLKLGDQVALVCLSNGLPKEAEVKIKQLCNALRELGLEVICSPYLVQEESVFSASAATRAKVLMGFYKSDKVKAIFDISGGDIANEVLEYLDYDIIKEKNKTFFGYSDLTTVINALYSQTGKSSYLYQIRNLIGTCGKIQREAIFKTLLQGEKSLLDFNYQFIQGSELEGSVVGGNIRCFLKLAGTKYMPDFKDKILFLESRSGGVAQMVTFLNQYKQIGAFRQIKGLILGSFTQMESEALTPTIEELVLQVVDRIDLPIVKTSEIGHGADSKAIIIGQHISLC